MSAQMRGTEPSREIHLEGIGLTVVGSLLIAALVGAFFVGRWSVQSPEPARVAETEALAPLENVMDPGQATEVDQVLELNEIGPYLVSCCAASSPRDE